jgi:hypothetical protein
VQSLVDTKNSPAARPNLAGGGSSGCPASTPLYSLFLSVRRPIGLSPVCDTTTPGSACSPTVARSRPAAGALAASTSAAGRCGSYRFLRATARPSALSMRLLPCASGSGCGPSTMRLLGTTTSAVCERPPTMRPSSPCSTGIAACVARAACMPPFVPGASDRSHGATTVPPPTGRGWGWGCDRAGCMCRLPMATAGCPVHGLLGLGTGGAWLLCRAPAAAWIAPLSLGGVVKVFTGFGMKKHHSPTHQYD